ncbi:MAG: DUF3667 domain-containing protein [Saprospiraceae bacterium]
MEEQDETTTSKTPRPRCKNCGTKLSRQGSFCPGCGQRDFDGRVQMRDLLAKFFANFTHLDNKFVKMCWQLFVPARVTIHYFQGKIKRYPNPVQFFFIVMFFFLLMFSKRFDDAGFNMTEGNMSIGGEEGYEIKKGQKLIAETGLFESLQRSIIAQEHRAAFDSLPPDWQTPVVRQAIDSVVRMVDGPWEDATRYFLSLANTDTLNPAVNIDTIPLIFGVTQVRIAAVDLVHLQPDSIIQKYGLRSWAEKVTVRQGIKSLKNPKGLIGQYVGSLGWAILVLIALMAFVLRLLYWRKENYYVEHFIFLMHQQSGAFLLFTFAFLAHDYLFDLQWGWLVVLAWIGVTLLVAMKRFYREKWGWTIAKWLVYCAVYLFALVVLFIGTLLVVFVVF